MDTSVAPPRSTGTTASLPRRALIGGLAVLGVVLVLLALLAGLRLARPGALPNVVAGGVDVGGLEGDALTETLAATGLEDETFVVSAGDARVEATGAELGYTHDVAATEDAVLRRGRQWNPVAALTDHLRAFGDEPLVVERVEEVDEATLEAWVGEAADTLDAEPVEGTLELSGSEITRVDPQPGFEIDREALAAALHETLLGGGPRAIEAPAEEQAPVTTTEAVDRVLADAEQALSGPIRLHRHEAALALEPEELAALLEVEREGADLALAADPERVDEHVDADLRATLETEPEDAAFTLAGGGVEIIPSTDGFRFDSEATAAQIVEVATADGEREAELDGDITEPGRMTADAEALGIVEQVSSFTTHFPAGQSRVTNIQRMADLIDGVVIEPGDTFSVNEHVGPRTRDKGFVEGGAIMRGEFVSEVGGGVSQFATTVYNAAYFGGYDITEFRAHSYYIDRYPAGREATLNYPDIDLQVRNSSPHGILVQTGYTGTSVTVTFWGTEWVEVESVSGARGNVRNPETEVRENPDLPAGAERVIQSGRQGFDITVTRVLRFPDGREEREEVTTRYLPEPRIVERGTQQPPTSDDEDENDDGNGDD